MSNPVMNDRAFSRAAGGSSAWGAPDPGTRNGNNSPLGAAGYGAGTDTAMQAPYGRVDDRVSPWQSAGDTMTKSGTLTAIGVLFALFLVSGVVGWYLVDTGVDQFGNETASAPPWAFAIPLVGFVAAIVCAFKPHLARFIGPAYAIGQGVFVGLVSALFNVAYPGIVLQAVGATAAVFTVMWFLYAARIIKVTQKLRSVIIGATLGVALLYVVALVLRLFGVDTPIINDASALGIGFSVLVAGIAAFNLLLDFDLIDRGIEARAPKYMEWYAAFGLLVTVVWLYLEILRLLSKLREN
jgi:uncharacterized YccA/Bax inhibitor family protein